MMRNNDFKLGTHNSATYADLVWWQRPFGWLINKVSRCQDKTIDEQLQAGVKVFNLQVVWYKNDWYISHGLAVYNIKLFKVLAKLSKYKDVYFQLTLDKNFLLGQNKTEFCRLVDLMEGSFDGMLYAWIEGGEMLYQKKKGIDMEERYWVRSLPKSEWCGILPDPRAHALKYNSRYRRHCESEYLMLDYFEYGWAPAARPGRE